MTTVPDRTAEANVFHYTSAATSVTFFIHARFASNKTIHSILLRSEILGYLIESAIAQISITNHLVANKSRMLRLIANANGKKSNLIRRYYYFYC